VDRRQLFKLVGRSGVGPPDIYRYEHKYVVTEPVADRVRQFIAPYLDCDVHMKPSEPRGYEVHSLYLDTPQLSMYRQTVEGIRNRYKLRIRFYDGAEEGLALLEIKTRSADAIHKQRAAITKSAAAQLLEGRQVSSADLLSPSERSIRALAEFCERRDRAQADAAAFVSYWREAYVSQQDSQLRVTLDRQITGRDGRFARNLMLPEDDVLATPGKVVLELKYSGNAPHWMRDLIRSFGLQRISFPKYVYCVDALRLVAAAASGRKQRAAC
jgi:SPX domain protein involved in polyphosphate accumulation